MILLWGENGSGKTSILESISFLCMTKSFVTSMDRNVIQTGKSSFSIEGTFQSDSDTTHTVAIEYPNARQRKNILLDYASITSSAELIGRFPLVTLSPKHQSIVTGSAAERRSFIDMIISQAKHSYLIDLIEYRRIVKHRNALLTNEAFSSHKVFEMLEPWNASFAKLSVRIIRKRREFLVDFSPHCSTLFSGIVGEKEIPSIAYQSDFPFDNAMDEEALCNDFLQRLAQLFPQEIRRAKTLLGPHRDDLQIMINGRDVRQQASQGQIKSILVALKIAEYYYLEQQLDEKPIILLDDVFSELDTHRLKGVLGLIEHLGQTFITSVNEHAAALFPTLNGARAAFHLEAGSVIANLT